MQLWFYLRQRHRHPTMQLVGVHPPFHVAQPVTDAAIQILHAIGRPKALPQLPGHSEALQGKRFLHPLHQTVGRQVVPTRQICVDVQQGLFRLVVVRFPVGCLQTLSISPLILFFFEVTDYILPLVIATPLDFHLSAKHILDRLREAFCAIYHAQ